MQFSKQGPKRRRYTRRELPYGQISLWGKSHHFKRDIERKQDLIDRRAERREARSFHPTTTYRSI